MKNEKVHIFCQESPEEPKFTYGLKGGKYTAEEVTLLIKMLPKNHKAIRIIWVDPSEYLLARRQREAENEFENLNDDEPFNENENGNTR